MIEIKGKNNTAVIYTDKLEDTAKTQIQALCDLPDFKHSKIRIMPDVHAGAGCTIGTTMTISNCVIPNLVGVDIGCGMEVIKLQEKCIDLQALDNAIKNFVPCGKNVHDARVVKFEELQSLFCIREIKDAKRIVRSIGTLGGGNHFIEANKDEDGNIYIVVHSGSRNLGKQVADYYQNLAHDLNCGKEQFFIDRDNIITQYKEQGRRSEIQSTLIQLEKNFKLKKSETDKDLACLHGKYYKMYIHDMEICQNFATLNRKTIIDIIVKSMNLHILEQFTTIHNYIDMQNMILRKGAVSAQKGEKLLIPMNMRDGSLICIGKGNPDWNNSAPHGAGRLMSRGEARAKINLQEYEKSMQGIYTSSVNQSTIDEAPFAYKPMQEILQHIGDTVEIIHSIKPIYNFKAGE